MRGRARGGHPKWSWTAEALWSLLCLAEPAPASVRRPVWCARPSRRTKRRPGKCLGARPRALTPSAARSSKKPVQSGTPLDSAPPRRTGSRRGSDYLLVQSVVAPTAAAPGEVLGLPGGRARTLWPAKGRYLEEAPGRRRSAGKGERDARNAQARGVVRRREDAPGAAVGPRARLEKSGCARAHANLT